MNLDLIPVDEQQALFDAIIRSEFAVFIKKVFSTVAPGEMLEWNWHIDAIIEALRKLAVGETPQVVINLPPRYLKSIVVSVAWPAWVMGHDPAKQVIVASYSIDLAIKHANDFRKVVTSSWYRRAFPKFRLGKNTEVEMQTSRGGFRLATSVGGSLTGRGADIIIVDDPLKAEEALSKERRDRVNSWFDTTLLSRLNDKRRGAIVVVMQRLHLDDLTGHVLRKHGWTRLCLPAIAQVAESIAVRPAEFHERSPGDLLDPGREPQNVLDAIKTNMGTFGFAAQYLQEPVLPEGQLVKVDWFRKFETCPAVESGDLIVQSLDTAYKPGEQNDYSVCMTWLVRASLEEAFLLNLWRDRVDFPQLTKKVLELRRFYNADLVLIEEAGSGISLIQTLNEEGRPVHAIKPTSDKLTRMSTGSPLIEAGRIYLPTGKCPWINDLLAEICAFPHGTHDDQVDSLSQFLNWMTERRRASHWSNGPWIMTNGKIQPIRGPITQYRW